MRFIDRAIDARGRSSRSEYWWIAGFFLVIDVLTPLAPFLPIVFGIPAASSLFGVSLYVLQAVSFVPRVSLRIRRLHDTGRSGLYLLIGLIPLVGWLMVEAMLVLPSEGDNQYGITADSVRRNFSPEPS